MPANPPSSLLRAVTLLLCAILLFDTMGAIIKHLGDTYPAQQLSMFRNLFGAIPSLIALYASTQWQQAGRPIKIRQWKLGLTRGVFIALAQLSFYLALVNIEFATASTIVFASPLFITALSIPILGHKVGAWRWLAVILGFIGIVMVIQPGNELFSIYAILPVFAAFCYSTNTVSVQLFDKSVSTAVINMYSLLGAIIGSVILLFTTTEYVPVQSQDWLWLISMGIAGGGAVYLLISAYRLSEPSNLSPFEYFGIPSSFVIGWLFFSEAPFDKLIPGAFLILGGGLLIIWRERKVNQD